MKYWDIRERMSGGGRRWGRNEEYGRVFGGFGTLETHQDFGKHKIGRYEESDIFDFSGSQMVIGPFLVFGQNPGF